MLTFANAANEWMVFYTVRENELLQKILENQIHPNPISLHTQHHWCGI